MGISKRCVDKIDFDRGVDFCVAIGPDLADLVLPPEGDLGGCCFALDGGLWRGRRSASRQQAHTSDASGEA